jgi:hypothetical protein
LPTFVVQTPNGPVTLEGVDESLWDEAIVGSHFTKSKGSILGSLEGEPRRVVPRTMPWWNEPK